jgi:hypothetical protein
VEYLEEAGEARSASEIETYFSRHFNVNGVTTACEYLGGPGPHRQGLDRGASHQAQQRRRSGAAFFVTAGLKGPPLR